MLRIALMLVGDGCVVDLIDIAIFNSEIVAAAIYLNRVTEACGVVAAEDVVGLNRTTNPSQLAVGYRKVVSRAATYAVRASILDAEVVESGVVRGLYDVASG